MKAIETVVVIAAAYLAIGTLVAFTLGRKWAAVSLPIVVLVWPEFLRQNRNWNRLP